MNVSNRRQVAFLARVTFAALLVSLPCAAQPATQAAGQPVAPSVPRIVLTAGRSTVLMTEFEVTRIAVTSPAVADAVVVQPREVLIDGKSPGTVSLVVWGAAERRQFDVVVNPAVSTLEQRLQSLFPGEDIQVSENEDAIILSGRASSNTISLRAAEIAAASASKAKVVNLLQLPGGSESQQVLLQVRFAEVSRRALMELGVSFFTGNSGYKDVVARTTTQQFAAPNYVDRIGPPPAYNPTSEGKLTFSDFLNLFFFSTKYDIGAAVRALESKGLFQSLAEPNLIAYNGQEASFLAGGEIPIPVVQGLSNAVTIQFKEYGIRLNFRPTIAGDTIRLKVRPEVSTLDFPNGIVLSGFRIPALATRRAETDVELRDGQHLAIAGLLDNTMLKNVTKIPLLGDIPILGTFFRSSDSQQQRTELLVVVTPRLVVASDSAPKLPTGAANTWPWDRSMRFGPDGH